MAPGERDPLLQNGRKPRPDEEDAAVDDSNPTELQGLQLFIALIMPLFGILVVALDVTLTSTISAAVSADFSSLSLVSWLGSAYLVSMTIIQSLSGSLSDRFGRRSGFFMGLLFFGIGNLMCGLARSSLMMIAGRAVAGAGGGAINSITTFVISDLVSLRRRPMWQATGNIAWAVGMGTGGVFGGMVNDMAGWRWAFIALTPLTLLVAVGSYFTFIRGLPRHGVVGKPTHSQSIDFLGSATLSGLLICLILGLNLTEDGIPKDFKARLLVSLLLGAAFAFLLVFIAVEKWVASDPVIPIQLLANRSVASSCLSGFFVACSMHTLLYYVPVFIQVQGYSTSEVGLQLLGEPVGAAIGPFLVGLAIRQLGSYAVLKPVSWIIYVSAPLTFFFCSLDTPVEVTVIGLMALGAGFGSTLTVNLTGLLANVNQSYQAKSTAMSYVFRQSGASVGLSVAGLIFRARVASLLAHTTTVQTLGGSDSIATQCDRHNFGRGDHPDICLGYVKALHVVFCFTLIAGAVAAFFGMMIKSQSLDQGSEADELRTAYVSARVRRDSVA